jgi:hypothetical protein
MTVGLLGVVFWFIFCCMAMSTVLLPSIPQWTHMISTQTMHNVMLYHPGPWLLLWKLRAVPTGSANRHASDLIWTIAYRSKAIEEIKCSLEWVSSFHVVC